jgi:hypothetical protein
MVYDGHIARCRLASSLAQPAKFQRKLRCRLWQFRHHFPAQMWFQWRPYSSRFSSAYRVLLGASMRMRMIAVLAVLTASFALGGCFFHHNQAVMVESQRLPPLK